MDSEVLAIIKSPHYGVGDYGKVCLWFNVYINEAEASLQVFGIERATAIIKDSGVKDVHDLNDRPCWVKVNNMKIEFLRMAKI